MEIITLYARKKLLYKFSIYISDLQNNLFMSLNMKLLIKLEIKFQLISTIYRFNN